MKYSYPPSSWYRAVPTAFCVLCILLGSLVSAELVDRIGFGPDIVYVSGTEMVVADNRIYIIYEQRAGLHYKPEDTKFTMEARAVDNLDMRIWSKSLTESEEVTLEPHLPKWSLAEDGQSIYLIGNSTTKGRSHLLFRFNLQGQVVSTKLLDGFIFQRGIQSTPYGLFIAFHDQIVALDKATFDILAIWNHPSPTLFKMGIGSKGGILGMKIDSQEVVALEFTESSWLGDAVPDRIYGGIGVIRFSLTSPMLGAESRAATINAEYSHGDYDRNATTRGTPEMLAIANNQALIVAMINESGQWALCMVSRDGSFDFTCNEVEQAAGLDAHEVRLSLVGVPGGGYLWGIPSMNEVILGIHTAEETSVRKLAIEEGAATAVRLAVGKDSIFALVDVTAQSETDTRRFIELHRMPLPPTNTR